MTIIATCGHKLTEKDGSDGMGYTLAVKDRSEDGQPAVSYPCVCAKCREQYKQKGMVLESDKEEMTYLMKKKSDMQKSKQKKQVFKNKKLDKVVAEADCAMMKVVKTLYKTNHPLANKKMKLQSAFCYDLQQESGRMEKAEIVVGGVYFDNKKTLRRIDSISGSPAMVKYAMGPDWLSSGSCTLSSFMSWSKKRIKPKNIQKVLDLVSLGRIKLAPKELELMGDMANSYKESETAPSVGSTISFEPHESRSARGLARKGLVTIHCAGSGHGEVILLDLGVKWIDLFHKKSKK